MRLQFGGAANPASVSISTVPGQALLFTCTNSKSVVLTPVRSHAPSEPAARVNAVNGRFEQAPTSVLVARAFARGADHVIAARGHEGNGDALEEHRRCPARSWPPPARERPAQVFHRRSNPMSVTHRFSKVQGVPRARRRSGAVGVSGSIPLTLM